MAIAIVQTLGVFIASIFGISILGKSIMRSSTGVSVGHIIAFGIGMAMTFCGMFL